MSHEGTDSRGVKVNLPNLVSYWVWVNDRIESKIISRLPTWEFGTNHKYLEYRQGKIGNKDDDIA